MKKTKVEYDGMIYKSKADLARALEIKIELFYSCLQRGYSVAAAVDHCRNVADLNGFVHDGHHFQSLKQLALEYQLSYQHLLRAIKKGMTLEEAIRTTEATDPETPLLDSSPRQLTAETVILCNKRWSSFHERQRSACI